MQQATAAAAPAGAHSTILPGDDVTDSIRARQGTTATAARLGFGLFEVCACQVTDLFPKHIVHDTRGLYCAPPLNADCLGEDYRHRFGLTCFQLAVHTLD